MNTILLCEITLSESNRGSFFPISLLSYETLKVICNFNPQKEKSRNRCSLISCSSSRCVSYYPQNSVF